VIVALNQRDHLLAFAGVLDDKLAAIARAHAVPESLVREVCVPHRLPSTSPAYWQGWNRVRAQAGGKFHTLFTAVSRAMADTPRSSSLVGNLNLRLRTYFTLRRHLGDSYLDLLTGAPLGCRVLSWRLGHHLAARAPAVMAKEARRLTARMRPAARQVPGDQDGPQGEAPVLASQSACQ